MSESNIKPVFSESVKARLETSENEVKCLISEEQKKAAAEILSARSASVLDGKPASTVAMAIQVTQALEDVGKPATNSNISDLVADKIVYHPISDPSKMLEIPCATCKMCNVQTAQLTDASVYKVYVRQDMRTSREGREANTEIKSLTAGLFSKPVPVSIEGGIVKTMNTGDIHLSSTLFPNDMRNWEALNAIAEYSQELKCIMMAEYLISLRGQADSLLKVYAGANRAIQEAIFEIEFTKTFGSVDYTDLENLETYHSLKRDYNAACQGIGGVQQTQSIDFGIDVRTLTISPNTIWKNKDKLARVRRYGEGSYYVSSSMDTGYKRIPTDKLIVMRHGAAIDYVTETSLLLLEQETRDQIGIDIPVREGVMPKIELKWPEGKEDRSMASLLGIEPEREAEIIKEMNQAFTDNAAHIVATKLAREQMSSASNVAAMFGEK